jgi:hypothetical protein
MNVRNIVTVVLVVLAFFAGAYWQKTIAPAQQETAVAAPETTPPAAGMPQVSTSTPTDVGLAWTVPSRWTTEAEREMRVATYTVPPAHGGDSGECAVFYFGPSQGGDPESNIDRWVGQFEHPGKPSRETKTIEGFPVKLVEVTGDYLAPSGPMMQSTGTKKGWMLKGAIVQGPNGNVFFKFVGPEATVKASAKEFAGMLESLHKS